MLFIAIYRYLVYIRMLCAYKADIMILHKNFLIPATAYSKQAL